MFGLGTATVLYRSLFEYINDALIEVSDHEICHNFAPSASKII
jgi:hypothetical protein